MILAAEPACLGWLCGTLGFTTIDGTDITPEMLDLARTKEVYRNLWQSIAGELDIKPDTYTTILAAGVISLGAAPAETLDLLLGILPTGGHLAFSYNDPTLANPTYIGHLEDILSSKGFHLVFREHGPHLPEKGMGSDVIVLRKG